MTHLILHGAIILFLANLMGFPLGRAFWLRIFNRNIYSSRNRSSWLKGQRSVIKLFCFCLLHDWHTWFTDRRTVNYLGSIEGFLDHQQCYFNTRSSQSVQLGAQKFCCRKIFPEERKT